MLRRIATAAIVMVGIADCANAYQAAQPAAPGRAGRTGAGMRRGGRNAGVITAIAGTTYTIKTMRGVDVKADIAAETPVVKPDRTAGTIKDLIKGVNVSVQGVAGVDGVVKATRVMIQNPMTRGTIQSVSAKRITLKGIDGKYASYLVTDKTTFRKAGQVVKATDYKAGDDVMVEYVGAAAINVRAFTARAGGAAGGGQARTPRARRTPTTPPAGTDAQPEAGESTGDSN